MKTISKEEIAEELWDKYSEHIGDDIFSLDSVAGSSVITSRHAFLKAVKEAFERAESTTPQSEVMTLEEITVGDLLVEFIGQKPKQFGGDYQERQYPVTAVMDIANKYASQFKARIDELEYKLTSSHVKADQLQAELEQVKAALSDMIRLAECFDQQDMWYKEIEAAKALQSTKR